MILFNFTFYNQNYKNSTFKVSTIFLKNLLSSNHTYLPYNIIYYKLFKIIQKPNWLRKVNNIRAYRTTDYCHNWDSNVMLNIF